MAHAAASNVADFRHHVGAAGVIDGVGRAEFARELYRTGQVHAGHGPERRHVPEDYVGLAFGLVLGFFAEVVPASRLGFWQGYLAAQQEVMRNGFHSALVLGAGSLEVDLEALGLAYEALPERLGVHLETGLLCEAVEKALVYLPALREVGLEPVPSTHEQGHWMEADTLWTFRPGWTLLVNGRDAAYLQGLSTPLSPGDTVTVLPTGMGSALGSRTSSRSPLDRHTATTTSWPK